jgi:co-chaperonin GroES (HSP10)
LRAKHDMRGLRGRSRSSAQSDNEAEQAIRSSFSRDFTKLREELRETPQAMQDRVILEGFQDDMRGAPLNLESRIVIPTMYAEPSRYSKVLAVGPLCVEVRPGDVVLSGRYPSSAWAFEHEGRTLVSVKEDEILAKIEVE